MYANAHSQGIRHVYTDGTHFLLNILLHEELGGTVLVEDTKSQKNTLVTLGIAHKNSIFSSTLLNTHTGTDLGRLVCTHLIQTHTHTREQT